MTRKPLLFLVTVIATAALVMGACAPSAAPEEPAEPEEQAPAEEEEAPAEQEEAVYHWAPSTWIGSGPLWNALERFGESLETMSNGRFEVTPSAPGAICPVDEQAEAVSNRLTPIMAPAGTYYGGKIPVTNVYGVGIGLPSYRDFVMAYEFYKNGRGQELVFEAYEEEFNVVVVGDLIGPQNILLGSNEPIDTLADIEGQKLRIGDEAIAAPMTEFGASTTFIPADEVYTSLATGTFDGFTMGNAADDYALSFHEVTKYWLKEPALMVLHQEPFLVNRDVWNEMPADLQDMVRVAADYADSVCQWEAELAILDAWDKVIEHGVTPVTWSEEDTNKYMEAQTEWAEEIAEKDQRTAELLSITSEYREYAGL